MKPDLTFYIDADPEVIQTRSNYGEERYEKVEFQKKVSEAYGKFKELLKDDAHWVTVKADHKSVDELHSEILERFVTYYQDEMDRVDLSYMSNSLFKSQ